MAWEQRRESLQSDGCFDSWHGMIWHDVVGADLKKAIPCPVNDVSRRGSRAMDTYVGFV
jgi:hypothetical protein